MKKSTDDPFYINAIRPLYFSAACIFLGIVAFSIWANSAKLTTTIHANGTLISSRPSHQLQHPYGGPIETLNITMHQRVEKGDILFSFDVKKQVESLRQIENQLKKTEHENEIIRSLLEDEKPEVTGLHGADLLQMRSDFIFNSNVVRASVERLSKQKAALKNSLKFLSDGRKLLSMQQDRIESLRRRGLKSKQDIEEIEIRQINFSSDFENTQSDILGMEHRIEQTREKLHNLKAQYRLKLLQTFNANLRQIPDLKQKTISLKDEIEKSTVRAPISGAISNLEFDTDSMFIPRGKSFATISRSLAKPIVRFHIPAQAIDQTHVGMIGKLTFNSLPQRNLPKINASVLFISPDATKDDNGLPTGYSATANFEHEKLLQALSDLYLDLELSADMPVSLALEGRKITFADYLITPFFEIFKGALED